MSGAFRLASGGRVDRLRPISFSFNGRVYQSLLGDSLASALLAHGVTLVARSFKFHRPRGVVGIGVEEPNALVQVLEPRQQALALATMLSIEPGLQVRSLNCWPGPRFDLGAVSGWLARLLPAGFYYKTFMAPNGAWPFYERWIRRAAGLGVVIPAGVDAPRAPVHSADPASAASAHVRRNKRFAHADILVVGAGPAGIAAALTAGRSGARVILADAQEEVGGAVDLGPVPEDVHAWVRKAVAEVDAMPKLRRLSKTQVFGFYEHGFLAAVQEHADLRQTLWKIRAQQVVLATGAIERPLLFVDNDRPGVMLASAVLGYAHRYAVACGQRVLIACNNDSAYRVAFKLATLGIGVAAIADVRTEIDPALLQQAGRLNIRVLPAHAITAVRGRSAVRGARLELLGEGVRRMGEASSGRIELACDLIAMSGGWTPSVHLHSQSGSAVVYDSDSTNFLPGAAVQASYCAGGANGRYGVSACAEDGFRAGAAAVQALSLKPITGTAPASDWVALNTQAWWSPPLRRGQRAFVDFANDVTSADLALAQREGYESVELMKRYTTTGMGVDQGKTSNVNAIGVLARLRGVRPDAIGTTTFRPPYAPIEFGTVAGFEGGPLIRPIRRTPMTSWHVAKGAVMYESGANWRRPGYYPLPGESMDEAVRRECLAVRHRVGFYDSTPLGKIEVSGPGALGFLEWVYAGALADLKPRRGRYGLMLREDGRLFDDGVAFRLSSCHFWVSTTAGNADSVYAWLEYLRQRLWKGAAVFLVPVTAQWANAVVCGPQARELLTAVGTDIELSRAAMPFMSFRDGTVAGLPARVFRVSFTGELSFEINVPASDGLALWEALHTAGPEFGLQPVGSEANHVLRIEKGYISIAHEADGMASPDDLGLGWAVRFTKHDFIGRRSLQRMNATPQPRRQLVGLLTDEPMQVLAEGAQIIAHVPGRPVRSAGHVTASVMSPALGRSIALALLDNGRQRLGERVQVTVEAAKGLSETTALVVPPVFYDPDGVRLHG